MEFFLERCSFFFLTFEAVLFIETLAICIPTLKTKNEKNEANFNPVINFCLSTQWLILFVFNSERRHCRM